MLVFGAEAAASPLSTDTFTYEYCEVMSQHLESPSWGLQVGERLVVWLGSNIDAGQ